MNDAEMMKKIRDQIAQGNVFFFKRGETKPHRISLDENGMPTVSPEQITAANALNAYANRQPEQMAKLLGDAIQAAVLRGRSDQGVKDNAALSSDMALRMLGMLEKDHNLKANCGIDADTLEGYKQELNGLRMIGEAYDKAGAANRKLAEAVKENRTLTEAESQQIATDLLTYRYLNALQVNANSQASMKPEIRSLKLINEQNGKMQIDQDGKRINPLVPGEEQKPVRDYYLNAAEKRDLDFDIKKLYTDPLLPVKVLGNSVLEQIRGHVQISTKVAELGQITDPMAFVKSFEAQDNAEKLNELVAEVNSSRNREEISKQGELLKQLQEQANAMGDKAKHAAPQPDVQYQAPQMKVPGMS